MSGNTPPAGAGPAWGTPGERSAGSGGPSGYGPSGPPASGGYGPGGYGPPGTYGPPPPQGPYGPGQGGGYPPAAGGGSGAYGPPAGPGGYPGAGGPIGPGGPAGPPPDYVYGGPGGQPPYQPPPAPRGSRPGTKAVIIAAVLTVLLGGGAVAFYQADPFHLFRAGPQAAEAIPADALFYVGVDLDPSAEQKVAALRFLNHFPAFRDSTGLDDANADVRSVIFSKTVETMHCPGLTYDRDVKPWIGSRFGGAGMPPADGSSSPVGVGVLEVADQGAAKTGLAKIRQCLQSKGGPAFGFAFAGDYALVAQTQAQADKYAGDARSSSLAGNDNFSADMESLGDLGVATVWANVSGSIDAFGQQMSTGSELDFLKSTYQRGAATFRFTSDSVEVVTSIFGDTPQVSHGENQIVNLPDSTVFAMSEAGGGQRVDASWNDMLTAAKSGGADVDAQIAKFEAESGLKLPEDLRTLFGDNLLLSVDSNGLTADALQNGDLSALDLGVRFTSDPAQVDAIYEKVLTLIQDQTTQQLRLVKVDADEGVAVATNDGYAKTLAGLDGNLGDSPEFQSVTDDAASKEAVLFFNWDSVEDQIVTAAQNGGAPQEFIDNIRPLRAFGITSSVQGHYTIGTVRLSVND